MKVRVYDATLSEGARGAGVAYAVRDRLRIALRLAEMGVAWIEAGWPARSPGDLFREARRLELGRSRLAACAEVGQPRRGDQSDLAAALGSGAPAVTLCASVLRPARRLEARLAAAVAAVRRGGRAALVDLGDFFDARRGGDVLPLDAVEAAVRAGAEAVLLSDTSGGALMPEVEQGVASARRAAGGRAAIGIRARRDAGVAVANSLAAVLKGATVVAGTVNGYGERCGAADLVPLVADLELKLGCAVLAPGALRRLVALAHFVADLADREPARDQPYAGRDAFQVGERFRARPHVDPAAVGNRTEQAMSDERGRSRATEVLRGMGLSARGESQARRVLARLRDWERRGFRYEEAEASFEMVLRELEGRRRGWFRLLGWRVLDAWREGRGQVEATVEVAVAGDTIHAAASGVGPVNALERALRKALIGHYPELKELRTVGSRSHALVPVAGTETAVRVVLESADGRDRWGTAGVAHDLLAASVQAMVDAIEYKLVKEGIAPIRRRRR